MNRCRDLALILILAGCRRKTSEVSTSTLTPIVAVVIEPVLCRNHPQKLPESGKIDFSDKLLAAWWTVSGYKSTKRRINNAISVSRNGSLS